jgi:predicted transposase/invertase (TIGR01784 family)
MSPLACGGAKMTQYDHSYKLIFSFPEMVSDLLTGFVREEWVSRLDMSTLEKINASFVSDDLKERHDDVIWRVRLADEWLYVYIVLEFQSVTDPYMSIRVLAYIALLYQDLVRTKQLTNSGKLPPVLPIVLYNGEPRWQAATQVFDLIENIPGSLSRYSPRLEYLLIDEGAYEQAELESLQSLVSFLFQLEKTPLREVGQELVRKLLSWLGENRELQRAFVVFLNRVYFKNKVDVEELYHEATTEEVRAMLEKNVERWIEEWKAEGEAKGRAEGEAKGRAEGEAKGEAQGWIKGQVEERRRLARKMLASGMSISRISELTEIEEEELRELIKPDTN